MENNVVLIGLMGAGKTTVGKSLAAWLEFDFLDTDEEIVRLEKMTITDIFSKKSEEYFRTIETKVIKNVSTLKNTVVSIGGGAFEKEENRMFLLNNCTVFYLQADIDVIYERIKTDQSRPLLECPDPKQKLRTLLDNREPNYKKAHYIIDANKSTQEVIKEIQRKLQ